MQVFPTKIQQYIDGWFMDEVHFEESFNFIHYNDTFYCHNCKTHMQLKYKSKVKNKYTRCIECTNIVLGKTKCHH